MTHQPTKSLADCRLYAFIDADYLRDRSPVQLARILCENGADIVQLRAKSWPSARIRGTAAELLDVTRPNGVRLVVNDHPDAARVSGADGCHLGQEDFFDAGWSHTAQLRPAGSRLEFGLSSHAPEQARRAVAAGADYVAIGPVYATPTKPGRPPVTLEYVRWAAGHLTLPWFAIGGVRFETLDDVLAAGATRVCVVSAILEARDPGAACREFSRRVRAARPATVTA